MNNLKGTMTSISKYSLEYGEYIDFVGGLTWGDFERKLLRVGQQDRLPNLMKYKSAVSGAHRYLVEINASGKLTYEILYLKVSALVNLFQMVNDYRLVAKSNMGNIDEETFRVELGVKKLFSPGLWAANISIDAYRNNVSTTSNDYNDANNNRADAQRKYDQYQDHYALGILVFRTLISNSRQNITVITEVLNKIVNSVEKIIYSNRSPVRQAIIEETYNQAIKNYIFSISNLYYKPNKSVSTNKEWNRLVILGLRLLSNSAYQRGLGVEPLENNLFSVDSSLSELLDIQSRAKAALLCSSEYEIEDLYSIVSDLISDKHWLASAVQQLNSVNHSNSDSKPIESSASNEHPPYYKHIKDLRAILKAESVSEKKRMPNSAHNNLTKNATKFPSASDEHLQNTIVRGKSSIRVVSSEF